MQVLGLAEVTQDRKTGPGESRGILGMTRPTFLYQSKVEILAFNSPLTLIRHGFRALQRLDKEVLECAPPAMC